MNPDISFDMMNHGLKSFAHPAFFPARERLMARDEAASNAFAPATGIDAAVVLAGMGLAVAPYDRKQPRILAEPSSDIDTVLRHFRKYKSAFVGYSTTACPFYIVLTDCARTLRERVSVRPELADVWALFQRNGGDLPPDPGMPFKHGMAIFAREPKDRIGPTALIDDSPHAGSILLFAGWREDGAGVDTYHPVPMQFLRAVLRDLAIAMWIWHPVGAKVVAH